MEEQNKNNWKLLLVILGSMVAYVRAWGQFFSGDDWFHLRVSQVSSFSEWLSFFSFIPGEQSISFYRPLSTQVFFWLGQLLFGLNAWQWYVVVWAVFGYSLLLVYWFIGLLVNKKVALWATFFYGFSVANFTKLYFLSAFQELLMVVFVLLAIIFFLKKRLWLSMGFWVLGLMSKETAVVLPGLLVLVKVMRIGEIRGIWGIGKIKWKQWLPFWLMTGGYLWLRLGVFGLPEGDSFGWDWSPVKAGNTLMWYGLWALGAPEFLVDYVGSGLRLLPRFWSDFRWIGWGVAGGIGGILFLVLSIMYEVLSINYNKLKVTPSNSPLARGRIVLGFVVGWFVISLLPVLFLPWHKFTLELTLGMVGVSMGLGWLVVEGTRSPVNLNVGRSNLQDPFPQNHIRVRGRQEEVATSWLVGSFVVVWLGYNLFINLLTYETHYSVNRSLIARRVYEYMQTNYPEYPVNNVFYFKNGDIESSWGVSAQVSHAVGGSEMFRVLYNDKKLNVFYEDFGDGETIEGQNVIDINSSMFLQPANHL